jgi:hypothetical protein
MKCWTRSDGPDSGLSRFARWKAGAAAPMWFPYVYVSLKKVAGKPSANYLCCAPCELGGICLGFEMKADLRSW